MKAILVIKDMPTECIKCPFHRIYADGFLNETHCILTAKRNKDGVNTKAEWCPLKPMPNKKPVSYHDDIFGEVEKNFTNIGWNDCLNALGETE